MPAEGYTRPYYENACGGHEEYRRSGGRELPLRQAQALALLQARPGMRVLDLGAGRGEVARFLTRAGARALALDWSLHSLLMIRERRRGEGLAPCVLADARKLPLASGSLDAVVALDLVEHLAPEGLGAALDEAFRVLAPGGRLVVHTLPNLWYYRLGYPLFRAFSRLRGERLPRDPRERVPFSREMHVNEQTPGSLRHALEGAGFSCRVRLLPGDDHRRETRRWARLAMDALVRLPLLRLAFCNDIYAVGRKR